MSNLHDYEVRFLDGQGKPIEDVTLQTRCLALAIDCAGLMGPEIGADSYYVLADGIKIRAEWRCRKPNNGTEYDLIEAGFFSH